MQRLGQILKEAREKKGLRQQRAADEISREQGVAIDHTTISRYERDMIEATVSRFLALCKIYNLPVAHALQRMGLTDREIGVGKGGEMIDPLWGDIQLILRASPTKRELLEKLIADWLEDLGLNGPGRTKQAHAAPEMKG